MSIHKTPAPWRAEYDDNGFYFIAGEGMPSPYIAATGGEGETCKANAEYAAHCVNLHEELVDALINSNIEIAAASSRVDSPLDRDMMRLRHEVNRVLIQRARGVV